MARTLVDYFNSPGDDEAELRAALQKFIGSVNYATIPDFQSVTGSGVNATIISQSVTVTGNSNLVWSVTVRGEGTPLLDVNGDSDWRTDRLVRTGDALRVQLRSSPNANTARTATVYSSGSAKPYTVRTA